MITSLPLSAEETERELGDADRLKFYLKNQRNRDRYWREIGELTAKDPHLMELYHQEMGRIHARTYGRRLRELGLSDAWVALLEGLPIASGKTKEDVERILREILAGDRRKFVYLFRLK